MEIYSIGFTQKSAGEFFDLLSSHGIRRLLDVRLNNVSQLAGFSKRDDLAYFLREIVGADYRHERRESNIDVFDTYVNALTVEVGLGLFGAGGTQ